MMNKEKKIAIYDIVLIAILSSLLFVQEQILSFLPNVQLTVFLLILFSKKLKFIKTAIIVCIHVILDNLLMSSFNIFYTPFMLIGWIMIPILLNTLFKKVESNIMLAFLSILFSFIYSWLFIIPQVFILEINPWVYFASDLPFEVILAMSSFITTILLYNPISKVFDMYIMKKS